ncbi:Proteasome subunit alpha type [Fasciola gigantica]|uniref:Proteasome subunit alpha type n=1 Tax=Fasciola gigantica TaxID=46835 RepID=A0A504XLR0_FASGI|nr:Proteasome subunit alpha type [Fasciola gigantica]
MLPQYQVFPAPATSFSFFDSIYTVHDEIKDKHFELDLSWVGECSGGVHAVVPQSLFQEAETFAKQALEDADDLDDEVE